MDTARSIPKTTFYAALARAKKSLFAHPVQLAAKATHSLAVRYDPDLGVHELHTTFASRFIDQLQDASGLGLEDCCFLALAHESGHIELNQLCVERRIDPADPDAQIEILSREGPKIGSRFDAQCHKESAIEAFCDAKLAAAITTHFPSIAPDLLKNIRDMRRDDSKKPHRFGDDYLTYPIFEKMIADGKIIDGWSAARLAYEDSLRSMSPLTNAWLSIKRPTLEKIQEWKQSRKPPEDRANKPHL